MSHISYSPKAQRRHERAALAARCVSYIPPRPFWLDALMVAVTAFVVVLVLFS